MRVKPTVTENIWKTSVRPPEVAGAAPPEKRCASSGEKRKTNADAATEVMPVIANPERTILRRRSGSCWYASARATCEEDP